MTTFLGGGGDAAQSEVLDQHFAAALAPGPVVYLPTALAASPQFENAGAWFRATYAPFGITDVVVWKSLDGKNLSDVPGIAAGYLGGGNTYYLLSELRRTGLLSQIADAAGSGLAVYGGSAGAIVLGADITTTDWPETEISLESLTTEGRTQSTGGACRATTTKATTNLFCDGVRPASTRE